MWRLVRVPGLRVKYSYDVSVSQGAKERGQLLWCSQVILNLSDLFVRNTIRV